MTSIYRSYERKMSTTEIGVGTVQPVLFCNTFLDGKTMKFFFAMDNNCFWLVHLLIFAR